MKKLLFGTVLMALAVIVPIQATAGVSVNVGFGIALPPLVVFSAPPALVVLPGTYVYVAPAVEEDIYFYGGWWWRPWEGHWYRSRSYSSGWSYYRNEPSFYVGISGWRNHYRERSWQGNQWNYQEIPYHQVQQNWRGWERNRHWERQNTWGVQGYQVQPRSQHRSREVQSQQYRSQPRTVNHGQLQQGVHTDQSQVIQKSRRSRSQQTQQGVQAQQSQHQSKGAKTKQSQQHGKPEGGEEGKGHGK
jgi:hypothetical protein